MDWRFARGEKLCRSDEYTSPLHFQHAAAAFECWRSVAKASRPQSLTQAAHPRHSAPLIFSSAQEQMSCQRRQPKPATRDGLWDTCIHARQGREPEIQVPQRAPGCAP